MALHELKKQPFFANKKLSFAQIFPFSHPKQSFSTLHLPFIPPLTYCLQRTHRSFAVCFNSLRCKAGISHRFKSLPAIPGKVVIPGIAGYLMNAGCFSQQSRIDRRFESSPGSREGRSPSGTFGSFRTSEKNKIVSLQEVSRFSKPRFTAHRQQLRTNKLKSFFRLAAVSLPGRHTPCAQITDAARNFGQRFCAAACANKRKNPSDICLRDFW